MSYENPSSNGGGDPWSKMWADWVGQCAPTGFAPPPNRDEASRQMRQAFMDAWARHCDEFLKSEAFLDGMKKAMDGALAFRQQLNEFLTRVLHENQLPARSDTDSILLVLRSMEERVLERIENLTKRMRALEDRAGAEEPIGSSESGAAAAGAGAKRGKGASR